MEQTELPESETITVRYAETDQDVVAIHQFLLIVARPQARAPIDAIASLEEVIRVTRDEVAIMAIKGGHLVGSLGLIRVPWWYAPNYAFMTERWHFVLPQFFHTDVDRMLKAEADSIAEAAGIEFIDPGKIRGKPGNLRLMPRSSRRESDTTSTTKRA